MNFVPSNIAVTWVETPLRIYHYEEPCWKKTSVVSGVSEETWTINWPYSYSTLLPYSLSHCRRNECSKNKQILYFYKSKFPLDLFSEFELRIKPIHCLILLLEYYQKDTWYITEFWSIYSRLVDFVEVIVYFDIFLNKSTNYKNPDHKVYIPFHTL